MDWWRERKKITTSYETKFIGHEQRVSICSSACSFALFFPLFPLIILLFYNSFVRGISPHTISRHTISYSAYTRSLCDTRATSVYVCYGKMLQIIWHKISLLYIINCIKKPSAHTYTYTDTQCNGREMMESHPRR